jgi:hypothetical protein
LASKDPNIRTLAGRIGGHAVHARHGSDNIAARARSGLDAKFVREVEEASAARGEHLSPEELERRVTSARRAYSACLALRSAQARRKVAGAK